MLLLTVRFQEDDLDYAWEEELDNDLAGATASNASRPEEAESVEYTGYTSYAGMVMVALGLIVGILLVNNWRFQL